MNEAIIENYLNIIQADESEYLDEGLREFAGKLNKSALKRRIDKLHRAFTKGDAQAFNDVIKSTSDIKKMPKYREFKSIMEKFKTKSPQIEESVELSKKVLKNTFKIKDKVKLEILGNAMGMIGWLKSRGGKQDPLKMTREALKEAHTKAMNIYDTGLDNMQPSNEEEEKMKKTMIAKAKTQEMIELILIGIIIAMAVAAAIAIGVGLWTLFAVWIPIWISTILTILPAMFSMLLKILGISAVGAAMVLGLFGFLKVQAGG
jgi:hypothetical protein